MAGPIKIIPEKEFLKENKKPIQEEVWNRIADKWEAYVVKKIPIVEGFLKGKKGLVVDIGCGNGRNMLKISGISYYGVDFSEEMIKNAEKYANNEGIDARLFVRGVDKLDREVFKDNMFDYGLFLATLHCIEGDVKREKALKEFYRVLKKGGEGLISVWNSEDKRFYGLSGDVYMSWRKEGRDIMRHYYLYNPDEFYDLLKSVGFEIVEVYGSREDRFSKKNTVVRVRK
jgi:ubiquinone/menaquinone biosynthesis C-methylase UbiE